MVNSYCSNSRSVGGQVITPGGGTTNPAAKVVCIADNPVHDPMGGDGCYTVKINCYNSSGGNLVFSGIYYHNCHPYTIYT